MNMSSGTSHDSTSCGGVKKWKNGVKKENSGNSVHLRVYGHVMSLSKHIHLILCISFVMPSSYFILFINAQIHLLSTAHCVLEPKVTKRYVQIMNICNPWLYWYKLVHTRTYLYILSYNTVYFESSTFASQAK